MSEELRVTVVATGLGAQELEKPKKVVDNTRKKIAGDGALDYGDFDKPTVMRNAASEADPVDPVTTKDMEYLDIPAFLRRQAD
jgi:cell division protein FtsZ